MRSRKYHDADAEKGILCTLLLFWTCILLLCWTCTLPAFAETRNIYIGDIVTMHISSGFLSMEELREKFQSFEIVEIENKRDGYLISVRTFEAGEHKIYFGDKEIVINIRSVLDDIEREDIFEAETGVMKPGFLFHWRILFGIAAGVFLLSGGFILLKAFMKTKSKAPTPFQTFLRQTGTLTTEDEDYFVSLTLYFKEYLESLYEFNIIGKTSAEIVHELKKSLKLNATLPEIQEWLYECDRLKFTGVKVSPEIKYGRLKELTKIAEKIDLQNKELTKISEKIDLQNEEAA